MLYPEKGDDDDESDDDNDDVDDDNDSERAKADERTLSGVNLCPIKT